MGQVFRDPRDSAGKKKASPSKVNGFVNLYAATMGSTETLIPFDRGINAIAKTTAVDGKRTPAILIATSPHRVGSRETPWQDHFEPDNGYIRYYGDNRKAGDDPAQKAGNKALLEAFELHSDHDKDQRARAVPLLFFQKVRHGDRVKGFAKFQGFGLASSVELVTQYSAATGSSFANYAFDFLVMSVAEESETFDWCWINKRRDPGATITETLELAPWAWRHWIKQGESALDRVRRRVSKLQIERRESQLPEPGSKTAHVLNTVYGFYDDKKKARFEALAAVVAERVIAPSGKGWLNGGLTKAAGDGGIDFIARLDVGDAFDGGNLGPARLVVLGQAKCEKPSKPTNGRDIARTVARLRRGWLGVYVTTSFFSTTTQREVIEDRYPVVLINGKRVAEEVHKLSIESGKRVPVLLSEIDETYGQTIALGDPEELLLR